jgi:RNA polymerase sigma-70 factor (ECF subfamily)
MLSGNSQTDKALVDAYKKDGNREYIGKLYKRYTHLVFGVCLKYLKDEEKSKDAVMDIFEKLIEDLRKYKIAQFKSWLYQVSKNYCLMQLRQDKHIERNWNEIDENKALRFMESFLDMHHNNEDEHDDHVDSLYKALDNLNNEQKACIELMYLKDKSYKEISGITGFTMKQVKSFVQNGKRNLKNILDKQKPVL